MSENKPLMLEATDPHSEEVMNFSPDQLEEAKKWLWTCYDKCKDPQKASLIWEIVAVGAGQSWSVAYTLDPEEPYTYEQLDFVEWLIAQDHIDEERKFIFLEQLHNSAYTIKIEEELAHKKPKTAEEEKRS